MAHTATRSTTADRQARTAVFAFFAVQGLTFASIITRLPGFADKFALDEIGILYLIVLTAACAAAGSLIAGSVAARVGSALTLRLSLAGVSVASFVTSLAGSTPLLYILFGAYGLFVGAVDATMNMQGVAVQDRYGRPLMAGFWGMWSAAAVLGALYASATIALNLPLAVATLIASAVGLLVNAAFGRHLMRSAEQVVAEHTATTTARVPWGPILLLGFATTCFWIADAGATNWSALYLQNGLLSAASVAPLAYAAYEATLLLTRLTGDRIIRRFGPQAVARASGLTAVASLVIVVAVPVPAVAIIGFAVLGVGLSLIAPLSYTAAAHLDAEGSDVAVSRVNVSNYVGFIFAAVVMGVVGDAVSLRVAFVIPLLAVPFIVLLAKQFRPQASLEGSS